MRKLKKVRLKTQSVSAILIVAGALALVGFGATFGLRWGLLAAVPALLVLGVAVGNEAP